MSAANEAKSVEGLGGWLILVGIGLVVGPIRTVYGLAPLYHAMFTDGTWQALTTPGSPAYDPLWAPYILFEVVFNAGLLLATLCAAVLFFSKKRGFPKLYIWIAAVSLVFIIVDALLVKLVSPQLPAFDEATVKELARSAVGVFIWSPYMLLSKRVKATFVN